MDHLKKGDGYTFEHIIANYYKVLSLRLCAVSAKLIMRKFTEKYFGSREQWFPCENGLNVAQPALQRAHIVVYVYAHMFSYLVLAYSVR